MGGAFTLSEVGRGGRQQCEMGCGRSVLIFEQNGKQGEVKSVAIANQQAMAEHAGQSS